MKTKSTPLKFGCYEPPTIDMSTIDDDEETNEEIPSEISNPATDYLPSNMLGHWKITEKKKFLQYLIITLKA